MAKGDRKFGRARSKASLQRKTGTRKVNKKVLIVCQGAETEHQYFSQFRDDLKLVSTFVDIPDDAHGFSAGKMLNYAKRRIKKENKRGDSFDKVFLVFDKDEDDSFYVTLNNIERSQPKNLIEGCYSIPCFEYWLLLHFEYSRKP